MTSVEVLCGPMLRRVTAESVTVFLALRSPRRVTLRVYAGEDATATGTDVKQAGSRDTVRLGEHLHVVAVSTGGQPLVPGTDYRYQVFFGAAGGAGDVPETAPSLYTPGWVVPQELSAAAARLLISYDRPGRRMPGFQLPPQDPQQLRVLHTADRLPHAPGPDALAYADRLIGAAIDGDGSPRPHLLVLSGNQIHADDVSATMLALVRRAVAELAVPDDTLPDTPAAEQPGILGPGRRAQLTARARFVTPTASHLLSFAEYAAMHLLVWSDVLWPQQLPTLDEVHPDSGWGALPPQVRNLVEAGAPYDLGPGQAEAVARFLAWSQDSLNLERLRAGLPAVRRALANVAVLTTPGEHEISGGWNAVRGRAAPMLGNPVGRRVLANGLAAHAVLQAWGNTPERFAAAPGATLLQRLAAWLAQPAPPAGADADAVAAAAGLPNADLVRPAAALTYHHVLVGPRWQLLMLDTQTQRGYPASPGDPPAPLADAALDAALATLPAAAADAVTIVVSQTPVLHTPARELAQALVDTTSWASAPLALHRMLGRLLTQGVAAGADGMRRRRLVLLGAGAGHGYAARLRYSADLPHAAGDRPVEAVLAHLVTGPARHPDTLGARLHRDGYQPGVVVLPWREFVGWNVDLAAMNPPPTALTIGVQYFGPDALTLPWQVRDRPQLSEAGADRRLDRRPQWRCRAAFVRSDLGQLGPLRPQQRLPVDPPQPPGEPDGEYTPWSPAVFAAAATNQLGNREEWSAGIEIVGEASLSDLAFVLADGALAQVRSTVWWSLPGKDPQPLTRFSVSTEPGPSCYDTDRYLGRALRRDDRDSAPGVNARYEGLAQAAGRLVRELQDDLVALGFLVADTDPAGQFGPRTEWAVREFQNYARCSTVAKEREYADGAPVPVRYVDRLESVAVAAEHRYRTQEGLSGVVNRRTRQLITVWLDNRWRCPVVIEALAVNANNQPNAPDGNHNNIWLNTQPGNGVRRVFATDFTGRYPGLPAAHLYDQPVPAVPPPAGAPALPKLVLLGKWTRWDVLDAAGNLEIRYQGQITKPDENQCWRPEMEMLPQLLLPGSPTLAQLVAAATGDATAAARLSTFKVYRAVSEVEAIGYFDSFNGYDNSFISLGPCHWTAGTMNRIPGPVQPQPGWTVGRGELWGFLALVRERHPAEFDRHFTEYGLTVTHGWTDDAIWDSSAHKYTSTPKLDTDTHPVTVAPRVQNYDYLHTWHSYYRMQLAVRTSDAIRRTMWLMARQRMADIMDTRWALAVGNEGVPDVSVNRPDPRPVIREVFTSERAAAFIYRWHILSPGGMVSAGAPGTQLRAALVYARVGQCGTCAVANRTDPPPWAGPAGPAFNTAPDTWTDAHEAALTAGLLHRSRHHSSPNMRDTIGDVNDWPDWQNTPGDVINGNNPRGFSLPLADLPDGAAPPGVNERQLKTGRGTFLLDSTDLPWPGGRQNQ